MLDVYCCTLHQIMEGDMNEACRAHEHTEDIGNYQLLSASTS